MKDLGIQIGREEGLEEGIEKGRQEGIEQGRQEGIEQGKELEKLKIAKSMLKEDVPMETIIKITELSKEEILSLTK